MSDIKSIFDLEEFKAYAGRWGARQSELRRRGGYYDGSIYTAVRAQLGWLWPRLYGGIKPLYLPLSRAVSVDAGIIPGGWSLPTGDTDQAYSPEWEPAVRTIQAWSNWDTEGVLFVHYGSQYGVSGLKVSDIRGGERRVIITPVSPLSYMVVESGLYDNRPGLGFWVETLEDANGHFEYAEVYTPDLIRTFRAGVPWSFDGREPEYTNEMREIPFVEAQHIKTGAPYGECTYQLVIPILDEVNQLASYLSDIVGRHSEPQWAIFGANAAELDKGGDTMWFMPQDARIEAILPSVDLPGILEFLREIRDQVTAGLPELGFDELRKKDQIATATMELQLKELVLKVQRSRPNYDQALGQAYQLAGRVGAEMGLGLGALDDPELSLDQDRPIIPLDPQTALALEAQELSLEQMRTLTGGEA